MPKPTPFSNRAYELGYPVERCPRDFTQQWQAGEQAAFDEAPDSCPYRLGSDEAFWWQRGFEAGEAVTAALDEAHATGEDASEGATRR